MISESSKSSPNHDIEIEKKIKKGEENKANKFKKGKKETHKYIMESRKDNN